ncbi:uncharacterized protein PV09_09438 [Verruconis gallopava]|uniref:Cutinase n=1 Tax=Verruconis gallopava TaxID=253628 RepID=A0A0D1YDG7_9PEZI|nr:uncharacterized protein PV09_09438 [Verruconis gallopava]KIV98786.1 hypothetical protein PV09_09438 [Verruconis gallopava]
MDSRPNIIFVLVDDHASKAISCYGAGINHTPNIDRLAIEGMLFKHCYVTNSICTPSRATILTGTHNHVNGVMTLDDTMVGKWHLGEGSAHEPSGFDYWSVLPGQGDYWDPEFIEPDGHKLNRGYVTDIITDKSLAWIERRDKRRPFFLMCHHKAPHRSWECDDKHKHLYSDPIRVPATYNDDYKNRAKAASVAKMRVAEDLTYQDLGLVQPDGGESVGTRVAQESGSSQRKIPTDYKRLKLIDKDTGEIFRFESETALSTFKFQRYMQRYLRTIQSIDDNVGRILQYLDEKALAENTIVIYSSDQGFFLGEHGWFDKQFMFFISLLTLSTGAWAAAICKLQTPGFDTENGVIDENCCAAMTVIFARGTIELGNVGTFAGPPFFSELRSQLGSTGVLVQGVDYPASVIGLLSDGGDGGPTMKSLIQQARSQCPDTKIIASGYSQGAEVVHNALSDSSIASLVSGAILFGDPDTKKSVGALPDDRVQRFCVHGDIICETGILIVDASHLSYFFYAKQAAAAAIDLSGV